MDFESCFGKANWIGASSGTGFIAVRDCFFAEKGESAIINILGFGRFILFLNGQRVHDELFLPLCSNFENVERKGIPTDEKMAARCYVSRFDISKFVCDGNNTIAILLGGGWYTGSETFAGATQGAFGECKVCYKIDIGGRIHCSGTHARYSKYFLVKSEYNAGEIQDYSQPGMEVTQSDYDDSKWENAILVKPLETEYFITDCPCDKQIKEISPSKNILGIYDAGINLTGYPVLVSCGGDVEITASEEINPDGTLDKEHTQYQYLAFKNTKKGQKLYPLFTWLGFRYFAVNGDAEVECVCQTHADVKVTSSFECDNETLNWAYEAFVHTMLSNMHEGMPTDCPQLERRGYTGDAQITCPAVFRTLGARDFYRKWIDDIFDCQDRITGHVQNTAPYTNSGGGPGGWGVAIVKVPYEYWKYYGDDEPARRGFDGMLKYLDFLESMSDHGLVTRTIPQTAWCLGEWALPDLVPEVPAAFVNTYFYVKAMEMCVEMADSFGFSEKTEHLEERIKYRKSVMTAAYFENFPKFGIGSHFVGGVQGADAFALDIGLGNENTVAAFINRYEKLDKLDTGIFGTEVVTRMLFKYGRGDIAIKLLTSDESGYGAWRKAGATTFWEYWKKPSRSLSHPMFGSPIACFFDEILGIKQEKGSVGYEKIAISPADIKGLDRASGSITTLRGKISVSYERQSDGTLKINFSVPNGVEVISP